MRLHGLFGVKRNLRMRRHAGLCCGMLVLNAVALLTFGCRQPGGVQTASGTSSGTLARSQVVTPIPFGQLRDDEAYNASGAVPLADSRFLFCDNHVANALYELDLTPDGQQRGILIRRPLQGLADITVDDLEGMTLAEESGHQFIFVASSLCLKKARQDLQGKPFRVPSDGLLRVTINSDQGLSAENMPGFRDWLIRQVPELAAAATLLPNDGGLNIEGLAWDRSRHALLFGVRTPVPEGKPLVIPVKVKELAGPWTTDNLEVLPTIRLSLEPAEGEQGIRSIEYVEGLGSFLVVAGKAADDSKAPFTLYEWDGQPAGKLRRLPLSFAKHMKPEGVTSGTVGGRPVLLFVDDSGGYQLVRTDTLSP